MLRRIILTLWQYKQVNFIGYSNEIHCVGEAEATNLSTMGNSSFCASHIFPSVSISIGLLLFNNIHKFVHYKYDASMNGYVVVVKQKNKFIERLHIRNWFVLFVRWIDITNLRTQSTTPLMNMCKLSKYYM